jgi:hypothetical protein
MGVVLIDIFVLGSIVVGCSAFFSKTGAAPQQGDTLADPGVEHGMEIVVPILIIFEGLAAIVLLVLGIIAATNAHIKHDCSNTSATTTWPWKVPVPVAIIG